MISEKDPVSVVSKKNKTKRNMKKKRTFIIGLVFLFTFTTYVANAVHVKHTYNSMKISFTSVKEIEYGTANYNPMDLVKKVKDGKIKKYTKTIDTTKLGKQELVFEVEKEGVVRTYKIEVNVKDTVAPEIKLNNEEVTITAGDEFDVKSNIQSVNDLVDGDIAYTDNKEEEKAHYIVETDFKNEPGEYTVNVNAVDSNNNATSSNYKIKVNPKPVVIPVQKAVNTANSNQNYYSGPASVDTSNVISAAKSLIGVRYTSGGTNPNSGFDCSGFVQYVYGAVGKSISRSSSTQLGNGAAVSESDLQAGDIIIWANNGSNSAAHSSIYAGDGTIIHATSNKGVQQSSLNNWKNWGQHIIGIRRV